MALTPRLDLRQTQSLVMTPQLQQAIKLLQFSSLELQAFVDTQLEQNPLLERDELAPDHYGIDDAPTYANAASRPASAEPRTVDAALDGSSEAFTAADLDVDVFDDAFEAGGTDDAGLAGLSASGAGQGAGRSGSFDDHEANLEDMLATQVTLKDHLMSQMAMEFSDPIDRIIGLHLIDMLDDAGYLVGSLDAVAEMLGCTEERVEATMLRLQAFDPAGVFARSLRECLTLQLQDRGTLDKPMQLLLANLELLARCDWANLCKVCGVSQDILVAKTQEIRSLNPKPALAFDNVHAQPVIPDVIMRQQPSGGWIVELNPDTLPRVLVNNTYYSQISRTSRNREDRQYISDCLQSANWLVKSLHQRATTILKVATEIIKQQQEFFVHGVTSLRPLVLRDIAEAIGMHESTVSRVTSNKYVSTPRGIYELKYFFTHAVGASRGGDAHSAEAVRHRLKLLIDGEAANNILSDDALAEVLEREGVAIARRTVAKYREAMGIPSSVQRRRQKADGL